MSAAAIPLAAPTGRRLWMLAGLGLAGVAIVAVQDSLHIPAELGIGSDTLLDRFVALGCVASVLWFAAIILVRSAPLPRSAVAIVLAVAVLLRLVPVIGPSFLSTDLYRYVWDGRVQNAGINPYRYIPADPELAPLRDGAIYPRINRADYAPTIYPPAAQALFAVIAWLSPTTRAMKLAMVAIEAGAVLCMVRLLTMADMPPSGVLIYAWNPVVVWEYAGNAHVDAAAIGFIALALLAVATRRMAWAGVATAAATLVKFLPVVLVPALWRERRPRMAVAFAATVAVLYACYASVGLRVFGFLGGYADEEGLGSGSGLFAIRLLGAVVPLPSWAGAVWILAVAATLGLVAIRMVWFAPTPTDDAARVRRVGADALLLATIVTVGLTPHYAWYFGWLAFLACLAPWRCVLWLTAACLLLYLDPIHTNLAGPAAVYGPFLLLAILDWRRPVALSPVASSPVAA